MKSIEVLQLEMYMLLTNIRVIVRVRVGLSIIIESRMFMMNSWWFWSRCSKIWRNNSSRTKIS